MKAIKIAALALVFAALGCSSAPTRPTDGNEITTDTDGTYEITTEIDEFTQVKSSTVELPLKANSLLHAQRGLRVTFYPDGRIPTFYLAFYRVGKNWSYLKCNHVDVLADDHTWSPPTKHDGDVTSGSVIEHVSFKLDLDAVRALGQSDVAKVRICNDVDELSDGMKATLLKLIDEHPPPVTCLSIQQDYEECLERGGVDPTLVEPTTDESRRLSDGTYEIKTEIHESTKFTLSTVRFPLTGNSEKRSLGVSYFTAPRAPFALVSFRREGSDWGYLKCNHVDLLADDRRLSPETDHDGDVVAGSLIIEYVSFKLSVESVRVLAEADVAKVRVCNDIDELDDGMKATLLKLTEDGPDTVD